MSNTFTGRCLCGEVTFEVSGEPAVAGFCYCNDCESWLAAPVNAFNLYPLDQVRITSGEESIGTFNRTEEAYRKFCTRCGGHVMTVHPGMKLTDGFASVLDEFTHKPTMHVNYENKQVSMADGLPKFRDLPAYFGGSGETLPD